MALTGTNNIVNLPDIYSRAGLPQIRLNANKAKEIAQRRSYKAKGKMRSPYLFSLIPWQERREICETIL